MNTGNKIAIFDVDGVIIDVSQTYHIAIKKTVEFFLKKEVPLSVIKSFKQYLGINNDYYVSYSIIAILKYGIPKEEVKRLAQEKGNEIAYFLKNFYLIPIEVEELIRIFITFFEDLKDKEKLLLEPSFFEKLKKKGFLLGVLTGRPKEDLIYSFKKFDLLDKFDLIVDDDTIPSLELRKPHPYALYYTIQKLTKGKNYPIKFYAGDTIADIQMVKGYEEFYKDNSIHYLHCNFSNVSPLKGEEGQKREEFINFPRNYTVFNSPEELKRFFIGKELLQMF
jgi:HAD superfamily phosphatase